MTAYTPPAEAVEAACRAAHPTRWEYRATAHPCEECATAVTAAFPTIAAEAWDQGAHSGLDSGLTIAENVHANGGVLDLASVSGPPINPYRKG